VNKRYGAGASARRVCVFWEYGIDGWVSAVRMEWVGRERWAAWVGKENGERDQVGKRQGVGAGRSRSAGSDWCFATSPCSCESVVCSCLWLADVMCYVGL
jgi:hypothetical protein